MNTEITDAWNGPGRRDGELTVVTARDNGLHPSEDKHAFEHWYFDAHLDSGHTVIGFLTLRRPEQPPGADPSVEILVYHPDGTRQQINRSYPKDRASFSTEGADVRIGDNTCRSDYTGHRPVHHLHLNEQDITLELTFANEVPSWIPGSSRTRYGDRQFFAWNVAAPRAAVSGSIRLGAETLTVRGTGYHDHNWGVGDMRRVIDRWHWGRLYTPAFTLLYATVLTQKRWDRHLTTAMMLARDDKVILSSGEFRVEEGPMVYDGLAHRDRPQWLRLHAPGEIDLRLDVQHVSHAHDLLDDVAVARHALVKPLVRALVGRPGYFRFDSAFELAVTLDGLDERVSGRTLHEMVALG
jgi:predicted secreted hydrolase